MANQHLYLLNGMKGIDVTELISRLRKTSQKTWRHRKAYGSIRRFIVKDAGLDG